MKRTGWLCIEMILVPAILAVTEVPASGWEGQSNLNVDIDVPVFSTAEDFSSFTAGAAWNLNWNQPETTLGERSYSYGIWIADRRFEFETDGMLLLDEQLNNQPLQLSLAYNFGFDLERDFVMPEDNLDLGPPEQTDMGALNFLYGYRFALQLQAGLETTQELDSGWLRFGPGLRLLHRHQSGWAMLLPNFYIGYEGVHELGDGLVSAGDAGGPETYSRFRLVQRHQINFGFAELENLLLAAGYQFTRDAGLPQPLKDEGLHTRLGFVGDLSYTYRFTDRENLIRSAGIFIRYTAGELAPFIESERTFVAGIRL